MQDDRHEDQEHDRSAAFAVEQAIKALNSALKLCADRGLAVEVQGRGYSVIGGGSWTVYRASVTRTQVINP